MSKCTCANQQYFRITGELGVEDTIIRCEYCDGKVAYISADAVRKIPDNPHRTVQVVLRPHDRPEVYDDDRGATDG